MTQVIEQTGTPGRSVSLPLLEVNHLRTHFPIRKGFFRSVAGYVKAVEDVSFTVGAIPIRCRCPPENSCG